jgi:hypothetical protein
MKAQKNISIIIPYFGKLPALARYYFLSCAHNSDIDFLFFTDQRFSFELPENVQLFDFKLKDFNKLASQKLGLNIKLRYPYKLCDFKPLYGHIFEEYLQESNFWGYTDLDMIFGQINLFVTDEILSKYDIITAREDGFAGNFTLFRNTTENKFLYRLSDNWVQIIKNAHYVHSFPERFKKQGRPAGKGLFFKIRTLFATKNLEHTNINDLNEIATQQKSLRVWHGDFMLSDEYFRNRKITDWQVIWENGKLLKKTTGKTALYFHFYRLKNHPDFQMGSVTESSEVEMLLITKEGVFGKS